MQGIIHCIPDPVVFPHRSYHPADCGNAVHFRGSNIAGGACAVQRRNNDPVVLRHISDLFWRNNIPVQKGHSSA